MRAIQALAEQMENVTFKEVLETDRGDIQEGSAFSDALAKHPKVFSDTLYSYDKGGGSVRYHGLDPHATG